MKIIIQNKKKRQAKFEAKKEKLNAKIEKLNAKLRYLQDDNNNVEEVEAVQVQKVQENIIPLINNNNDNNILCMCGAPLIQTISNKAYYEKANVHCDICGKYCPNNDIIYHCPNEKHSLHPEGYDLCDSCVSFQMQSFYEQQQQQQQQQQSQSQLQQQSSIVINNNNNNNSIEKKEDKSLLNEINQVSNELQKGLNQAANEIKKDVKDVLEKTKEKITEVVSPILNNNNNNKNDEVKLLAQQDFQDVPSTIVIKEKESNEEINNNDNSLNNNNNNKRNNAEDDFPYPQQLKTIQSMGFNVDMATVKFLLIKHKGDVSRVIHHIMPSN